MRIYAWKRHGGIHTKFLCFSPPFPITYHVGKFYYPQNPQGFRKQVLPNSQFHTEKYCKAPKICYLLFSWATCWSRLPDCCCWNTWSPDCVLQTLISHRALQADSPYISLSNRHSLWSLLGEVSKLKLGNWEIRRLRIIVIKCKIYYSLIRIIVSLEVILLKVKCN